MKFNVMFLRKVIFIFSILLGSIDVFSQATYSLEYPSSQVNLDACGAPVQVKLKIQNGSATQSLTGIYSLGFNYPGLYFTSVASSTSNVTFGESGNLPINDGDVVGQIQANIAANANAEIIFNVRAGCTIPFPTNQSNVSLASPLKLTLLTADVPFVSGTNKPYTIQQGSYLTYTEADNLDGTVRNGDLVIRKYIITNISGKDYTGYVRFADHNFTNAVSAQSVKFYYENHTVSPAIVSSVEADIAVTNTDLAGSGLLQGIHVPNNYWLIIEETVKIVGCVDFNNGKSDPVIQWGCYQYDLLPAVLNIDANITLPSALPTLTLNRDDIHINTNMNCLDGSYATNRTSWINTSTTPSRNVRLIMNTRDNTVVPLGHVRVYIKRNNGVTEGPYNVNYDANNIIPDALSLTGMHTLITDTDVKALLPNVTQANIDRIITANTPTAANIVALRLGWYSYSTDYNYAAFNCLETANSVYQTYGDYANSLSYNKSVLTEVLPQSGITGQGTDPRNVFFVRRLVINKLIDAQGGHLDEIILNQNETVTVEWDEYTPCPYEGIYTEVISSAIFSADYTNECGKFYSGADFSSNIVDLNTNLPYLFSYTTLRAALSAGVLNTAGEVDRCLETADGRVEQISYTISAYNFYASEPTPTGVFQFKLFLEDGLDFDRSLATPYAWGRVNNLGYNNLTNASTNCSKANCNDATCHPSTNVVQSADRYVFSLKLQNGTIIPAQYISITQVAADNDVTDAINPITYLDTKDQSHARMRTATFEYAIMVDIASYCAANNITNYDMLRNLLHGATVTFDVRAYCPSSKHSGPTKWDMKCSWIKCPTYVSSSCGINIIQKGSADELSIDSYNAISLFGIASEIQVNCPGCTIPGSEIHESSLLRTNVGLIDDDNNGKPDGTASIGLDHLNRRLLTTGDTLESRMMIIMPDGQEGYKNGHRTGLTKAELDSMNYLLDNLYVEYSSIGGIGNVVPGSVQAAILTGNQGLHDPGIQWVTIPASDILNTGVNQPVMIRIKASTLGATQIINNNPTPANNFNTDDVIVLRTSFEITMNGGVADNIPFNYRAGFSGCDDCSSFGSPIPVTPPAGVMADFNPASMPNSTFDMSDLITYSDQLFMWCTNGADQFHYIPFYGEARVDFGDKADNMSCKKVYSFIDYGRFYMGSPGDPLWDAFPGEYRRFLNYNARLINRIPVPTGYEVYSVSIDYAHLQGYEYEEVKNILIDDITQLHNMTQTVSPANSIWGSYFTLNMESVANESNTIANLSVRDGMDMVYDPNDHNPATLIFPLSEENYQISGAIYLRPISCDVVPTTTYSLYNYFNGLYKPLSNFPSQLQEGSASQNANWLKNLGSTASYTVISGTGSNPGTVISPPVANVTAYAQGTTNKSTSSKFIQIPVRIDVDAVSRATFPYFLISGPAMQKGLVFKGVYMGNANLSDAQLIPYLYNHYKVSDNTNRWIAGVDANPAIQAFSSDAWYYLEANTSTYFTLVFDYDCGNCSPYVRCDINTNLDGQLCLNGDILNIAYGWNCNVYPSFENLNNVCAARKSLDYNITTSQVGLATKSYINDVEYVSEATVTSCSDFIYKLDLTSCKPGTLNDFVVRLSLPAGVTASATPATITLSDLFTITPLTDGSYGFTISAKDPTLGLPQYVNTDIFKQILLSIPLKTDCSFNTGNIVVTIDAKTYCGASIVPITQTLAIKANYDASQAVVDNITDINVSCGPEQISVIYTVPSALPHANKFVIEIPAGFKLKNSPSAVRAVDLSISTTAGTYTEIIEIEKEMIECGKAYPIHVYLHRGFEATCGTETCSRNKIEEVTPACSIQIAPFAIGLKPVGHCVLLNSTALEVQVNGQDIPDLYDEDEVLLPDPYTYQWYKITSVNNVDVITLIPGATSKKYYPQEEGIYKVVVDNGQCTGSVISQMMYINPYPTLVATNGTSFLCDEHSHVDLEVSIVQGGTPGYSYYWVKLVNGWGVPIEDADNTLPTYTATTAGEYYVTVTDSKGCAMATSRTVADHLDVACPADVCPGINPMLTITNLAGAQGTYVTGWFREGDDALLNFLSEAGDYKGVAIAEGCTLTTAEPCHINFLPQPLPFSITPGNYVYSCEDVQHTVSIVNKTINDVPADGNYYNDNITYQWSNGSTTLDDQIFTGWGELSITAIHNTSGCAVRSNRANFIGPHLSINRSCGPNGKILLNASTNFEPGSYNWYSVDPVTHVHTPITNPALLSNDGSTLTVSVAGIYGVTNTANICSGTQYEVYEDMITTAAPNANMVSDKDGKFENTTLCADVNFTSALGCVDRSFYKTNGSDQLITGSYGSVLPGNYMINYSPFSAGNWNPGFWQGWGFDYSPTFMIVDGIATISDQVVWSKTYSNITPGHRYLFNAMVRNISAFKISPVPEAIPAIYLRVTYTNTNTQASYYYNVSRQILYQNTNYQWIELSAITTAQRNLEATYVTNDPYSIKVEIVMEGGSAVGRDIAIDNISLVPVGICDNLQTILDNTGRNCGSVAQVDFYQKVVCPGGSATYNVLDLATDPNVMYNWSQGGVWVGSGKTFTVTPSNTSNYTLTVSNIAKNCSFTQDVVAIVLDGTGTTTVDNKEICQNGSVQLSASATGATKYTWTPSTGLSNPNIANPVASNLTATTVYQVVASNGNGCSSASQNVTVTYIPSPTVSVTPINSNLCTGTPLTLTASGADSYVWTSRSDLVTNGATATLTLASDPGNTNTSNTITVTGTKNGCSASADATVVRKETPVVTFTPPTICAGGNGDFNTQASGTYNYTWSSSVGLSSATAANPVVAGSYPRSYNVTITDPSNTCSVTQTVSVTVNFACGDVAPVYDGVDDRTTIPYITAYNRGSGDFTVQAWVKLATTQNATYPTILASRTAGGNGFLWSIDGSGANNGKRMLFQILGSNYYSTPLSSTLYDNQCHHLAVTRTTAGVLTLYIDGVNQGQYMGVTGSINTTNTIMTIATETNGTQPLKGSISEVQFWNYAFAAQDIADYRYSLFNTSNMYLIGYWKFRQTGTQVAVDESGVRNDGYYGNSVSNTTYDPSFTGGYCGGPKVLTVVPTSKVCIGKTVTVNYTTAGFASGVQLQLFVSNASGVFSGTPNFITTNGTNSGTFTFTASNIVGTGYLVKIKTSDNTTEVNSAPFEVTNICMGLLFDGDRVATAPNHSAYNVGTGNFTIEANVNFNSPSTTQNAPVVASYHALSTSDGFTFRGINSGTQMALVLNGTTYNSDALPGGATLYDGLCHHVAVVRTSTTSITFYIDGIARGTRTIPSTKTVNSSAIFRIGGDADGNRIKGRITEVRYWNVDRSANISGAMFSSFNSSTSGLIGYWRFNEVAGVQTIYDESGTANHGVLGLSASVEGLDPVRTGLDCSANGVARLTNTNLDSEVSGPQITYYPNPFDKVLTVLVQDVATEETTATIQLMNVNGVEVYKGELQLNIQNELHLDLPAGMYMAIIRYHNNSMYQHKVIKVQ